MREEDADAIRGVDAVTFYEWGKQVKGEKAEMRRRTRSNVLACLDKDPQGCFVAEEDGRLVGFIFARTWGGVGWFGTFAVVPQYQRQGIGKRLIASSLEYLQQRPDRVIGLETMPASPYNLGLYLKLGFQARFPTMLVSTALEESDGDGVELPHWSRADAERRERWLAELREATGQLYPGLDYSKEVTSTARYGLGETLVLTEGGRAVGLSVVRLKSSLEGQGAERAVVQPLAIHPDHTDDGTFRMFLNATEALARSNDKQKVVMAVNGCHTWALERLLEWGYRIDRMAVHMVLKGTDGGPRTDEWVDFSRWAG
jgi:ribosomal protein S18 acetylase RimI-like enzyme